MAPRLKLLRVTAVLGRGNLTETLVADVEEVRPGGTSRSAVVKRLHPSLADSKGAMRRPPEAATVPADSNAPLDPKHRLRCGCMHALSCGGRGHTP